MRTSSPWLDDAQPGFPGLTGTLEADLVVVGAGWVGAHIALLAARAGLSVVVVEADRIARGTTAGSTGKVSVQHGTRLGQLLTERGEEVARRYAAANVAGVRLVGDLGAELGAVCDLARAPAVAYATEPSGVKQVLAEHQAGERLGLPVHDRVPDLPFDVLCASVLPDQIHLDPARYTTGLLAASVELGVRVVEHSRIRTVEEHDGLVVVSDGDGEVRAAHAAVATLLPPGTLGGFFARVKPVAAYGIACTLRTAAPDALTLSTEGWSTRPWLARGERGLVAIGGGHQTGRDADAAAHLEDLERWLRSQVEVEAVEHRWFAEDYQSADLVPLVGRAPGHQEVFVATGFGKWGLSNGAAAALAVVGAITGTTPDWAGVYDPGRLGGVKAVGRATEATGFVAKERIVGRLARLTASSELPGAGDAQVVRIGGRTVGVHRDERGSLHAVDPTCTHLGCPLHWNSVATTWDCACHGSRFDQDGAVVQGPATEPLDRVSLPERAVREWPSAAGLDPSAAGQDPSADGRPSSGR